MSHYNFFAIVPFRRQNSRFLGATVPTVSSGKLRRMLMSHLVVFTKLYYSGNQRNYAIIEFIAVT